MSAREAQRATAAFISTRPGILRAEMVREVVAFVRGYCEGHEGDESRLVGCMSAVLAAWGQGAQDGAA